MKSIFLIILSSCSFVICSQSNFTVFNNGGQSFYVILNGIKQNSLPQTNVVVGGLKNSAFAVKLIFSDGKTPDIDKNFFIEEPSDITTRIIFKKGKGKLQLISMVPTAGISNNASVITFRPDNSAIFSDAVVVPASNVNNTNSGTVTVVETTTTQTTTTNQGNNGQGNATIVVNDNTNPGNVNMNIGINSNTTPTNGNLNMNVGVNTNQTTINSGNVNMNIGVSSNTNQTNSNSGNLNMNVGMNETNTNGANVEMNVIDPMSGQQMNVNMNINATGVINETNNQLNLNTNNFNIQNGNSTVITSTNTTTTTTSTTTGNTTGTINISQGTANNNINSNASLITGNKIACNKTLNNIEAFIIELKDQSFEGDREEALQLALVNTCLYTTQAEKLIDLFTFSEYKLSAAKFLSDRLLDRENATALAKHFNFEEDKMEYRRYISGKN